MALDYDIIGNRIKQARIAKNYTQEDLAEQLDVSVAFLSRAERGTVKMNLTRMDQLCNILDIDITYIIAGTTNTSKAYLAEDFSHLLQNCSPEKVKLIYDIAKVVANA